MSEAAAESLRAYVSAPARVLSAAATWRAPPRRGRGRGNGR